MEQINQYISVEFAKENDVSVSECRFEQDKIHLSISYFLADNDSLFDFSEMYNKVTFRVVKSYFNRYDQWFDLAFEKQNVYCDSQSKIFDLIHCSLEGISRKMYIESIFLHLLAYSQKNNQSNVMNCSGCNFLNKPNELEKIQKAKDYIINHIDQNLTIPMVASFVGTNQCYLKKGFKEITGQTFFEFLKNNRMIKAQHLIQNTNKSIHEVANLVGYASTSSFSQAYKNYFGFSPMAQTKVIISNN